MSSANAAPEEEMVAMVAANNAAFFATVLILFFETTFFAVFCFVFVVRWMMMKIKREREREREREECEYFFPETPNLSFARLLPVKVADGGRISSHSASFRREERINEKRRNPPLSLSRRDAREKGEVKGVCERSRDDDPYFCHLDWSSLTGKNQSREREKHHPPQTFARKARKGKESEKKKNRERTTGTESFTLFALDAETTTVVAEMENIF